MRSNGFLSLRASAARTAVGVPLIALAVAAPAAAEAHGSQPVRASQIACAGADTPTTNVRKIQRVVLCLHNLERGRRGLSKLYWNRDLAGVATKYAHSHGLPAPLRALLKRPP